MPEPTGEKRIDSAGLTAPKGGKEGGGQGSRKGGNSATEARRAAALASLKIGKKGKVSSEGEGRSRRENGKDPKWADVKRKLAEGVIDVFDIEEDQRAEQIAITEQAIQDAADQFGIPGDNIEGWTRALISTLPSMAPELTEKTHQMILGVLKPEESKDSIDTEPSAEVPDKPTTKVSSAPAAVDIRNPKPTVVFPEKAWDLVNEPKLDADSKKTPDIPEVDPPEITDEKEGGAEEVEANVADAEDAVIKAREAAIASLKSNESPSVTSAEGQDSLDADEPEREDNVETLFGSPEPKTIDQPVPMLARMKGAMSGLWLRTKGLFRRKHVTDDEGRLMNGSDGEQLVKTRPKESKGLKNIWGRIKREWTGEVAPENQEIEMVEGVYAVAAGTTDIAMRIFAVRSPIDLLQYVSQKIVTRQERARLEKELGEVEVEVKAGEDPVEKRSQKLREKLASSTFLTSEQKETFLERILKIEQEAAQNLETLEEERNKKIGEALEEFIKAKKTGLEVGKQLLSTGLFWSGFGMLRSAVYGGMSLYQRHNIKSAEFKERGEGTSSGKYYKELLVDGVSETVNKLLTGGGAETTRGRITNRLQAAGVLTTAFGIVGADYAGAQEVARGMVDDLLSGFEAETDALEKSRSILEINTPQGEKSASTIMYEWLNPGSGAGVGFVPGEVFDPIEGSEGEISLGPEPPDVQIPDVSEGIELKEFAATGALVRGEDGITNVLARQFANRAEEFGYDGTGSKEDWSVKQAVKLAKKYSIINKGDELRLNDEAIGTLAIPIERAANGSISLQFLDASTGEALSDDQLDAMTYKYSSDVGGAVEGPEAVKPEERETITRPDTEETLEGLKFSQNDYKQILIADPDTNGYSGWSVEREQELVAQGMTPEQIAEVKNKDIEAWADEQSLALWEEDQRKAATGGGEVETGTEIPPGELIEKLKVRGYQTIDLTYDADKWISKETTDELAKNLRTQDYKRAWKRALLFSEENLAENEKLANKAVTQVEATRLILDALEKQGYADSSTYTQLRGRLYDLIQRAYKDEVVKIDYQEKGIKKHLSTTLIRRLERTTK